MFVGAEDIGTGTADGARLASHSTNPGGHPKYPPRSIKSKQAWWSLMQMPTPNRHTHDTHAAYTGTIVGV